MQESIKKGHLKMSEFHFFLTIALAIVCIPIFSILVMNTFFGSAKSDPLSQQCSLNSASQIAVTTDKQQYQSGEKITLSMENGSQYPVYFEPCKFQDVFEKQVGNDWVLQEQAETDSGYTKSDFQKKAGNTQCDGIALPAGAGTYRMVVPVFYDCTSPSRYACQRSELSYSNQFQVLDDATVPAATDGASADASGSSAPASSPAN